MNSVVVAEVVCANTEDELVEQARFVMSSCNWQLGMIASNWTKRFAKGRTDASFGELIGLSADQVYQRRRVWETFADVYLGYPALKWSHFVVALTWDDAAACLGWAEETQATVGEMRAWRRAEYGEDLSREEDGSWESGDESQAEALGDAGSREAAVSISDIDGECERSPEQVPYAPFSQAARSPERSTAGVSVATETPNREQVARRLLRQLKLCATVMDDQFHDAFESLPGDVQDGITEQVGQMAAWIRQQKYLERKPA